MLPKEIGELSRLKELHIQSNRLTVLPPELGVIPLCSSSRPQAEFFYIYGWLIKICGCFSAKPENCGEGIFRLKTSAVYQICGQFLAKACRDNKNFNIKFQQLAKICCSNFLHSIVMSKIMSVQRIQLQDKLNIVMQK